MTRVFVDTSAWYALVDRSDQGHRQIADWIEGTRNPLVTSDYVFDETVTLLRMRLGHRIAVAAGEHIRSSPRVELVGVRAEDREAGWETFRDFADQDYSFTDATSFALMRRLKLTEALALDAHFRIAGFQLVGDG